MMTRVGSCFAAGKEAPFNVGRQVLTGILPGDFVWSVSYSTSKHEFNCRTSVRGDDDYPYELGVILRFKITKSCELYASELVPSHCGSLSIVNAKARINGQAYKRLKEGILSKLTKKWRDELLVNGVRSEF